MAHESKLTRRQILKGGAALAAGALAWPTIATENVFAAEGRPGANDRVGVGYIAVGRRSANLRGRGLPQEGRVVATADCNIARAEGVAKPLGAKSFQDYRKLLELKEVDAVVIASPDHWHALHAIHACQAGKDIYVEKPMTLTIREGRAMVEAARKHERIVQCGSQQRSMAPNRIGCELVLNGRIGKLKEVIGFNYPSPWEGKLPEQPIPKEINWDMWCGATEIVPYNEDLYLPRRNPGWISFRPWSGGEMAGWGAHGLDQIQWALGLDESGPVEIWTEGEKFDPPTYTKPQSRDEGEKICSSPLVRFRTADGVVVKLDNGPHGGAVFVGEKGKITIDRDSLRCEPKELADAPLGESATRLYVSTNHMQNWFDCMRSRKLPAADVEIGHRAATLCHLGNIARWVGRKLRWDPKTETFPGDKEANQHIDRERRKGYELPTTV